MTGFLACWTLKRSDMSRSLWAGKKSWPRATTNIFRHGVRSWTPKKPGLMGPGLVAEIEVLEEIQLLGRLKLSACGWLSVGDPRYVPPRRLDARQDRK
jgi:hypothetical protein